MMTLQTPPVIQPVDGVVAAIEAQTVTICRGMDRAIWIFLSAVAAGFAVLFVAAN